MAKGHKKIAGSYCYKGNGCTSRFCEFCCNGDKYEEIEHEYEDENLGDKLVELYAEEIGNMAKDIEVLDTCLDLIDVFIKTYFCRNGGCKRCPLARYTEPDHFTACRFDDFVGYMVNLERYLAEKEND